MRQIPEYGHFTTIHSRDPKVYGFHAVDLIVEGRCIIYNKPSGQLAYGLHTKQQHDLSWPRGQRQITFPWLRAKVLDNNRGRKED